MKTLSVTIGRLLFSLLLMLTVLACKKDGDDIVRIQSIVPQEIIDKLVSKGMIINDGIKPPSIEDAFVVSPYVLKSPFGPEDTWREGKVIEDYFYKFYGQNDKNEIKYDYYNEDKIDEGVGAGAFIAGDGDKFTIFSEDKGTSKNVEYKNVTIISGEMTQNGIKNFQYAFVLKEKKGDDNNTQLIPVGAARVWFDGNFLSETTNNFRRNAGEEIIKNKEQKSTLSIQ